MQRTNALFLGLLLGLALVLSIRGNSHAEEKKRVSSQAVSRLLKQLISSDIAQRKRARNELAAPSRIPILIQAAASRDKQVATAALDLLLKLVDDGRQSARNAMDTLLARGSPAAERLRKSLQKRDLPTVRELWQRGVPIEFKGVQYVATVRVGGRESAAWPDVMYLLTKVRLLGDLRIRWERSGELPQGGLQPLKDMRRLRTLELPPWADDKTLFFVSQMPNLESLTIHQTAKPKMITSEGVALLAKSRKLRSLSVGHLDLSAETYLHLSKIKSLRTLAISQYRFNDECLEHVAKLKDLEHLRVTQAGITDDGLAHVGKLKKLRYLTIDSCAISNDGLVHLRELKNLQLLALRNTFVSFSGFDQLKKQLNIPRTFGDAFSNPSVGHRRAMRRLVDLGARVTRARGSYEGTQSLRTEVWLKGGWWEGKNTDLQLLADLDFVDQLRIDAPLGGPEFAAHIGRLRDLNTLLLHSSRISDADLGVVSNMKHLRRLSIRAPISDKALTALRRLKQIEAIYLIDVNITPGGLAALKKALPRAQITASTVNRDRAKDSKAKGK